MFQKKDYVVFVRDLEVEIKRKKRFKGGLSPFSVVWRASKDLVEEGDDKCSIGDLGF